MSNSNTRNFEFETINLGGLQYVIGGKAQQQKQNRWQQAGQNFQQVGGAVATAGGIGSLIPVLGETGVPEALSGAGLVTLAVGQGLSFIGDHFA